MLTVDRLDGCGGPDQRMYLLGHPSTLVYAEPAFLSVVTRHLGARAGWLIARRDGAIAGLLPFAWIDGPLGAVYNSLAYYGSNGGVIQQQSDTAAKLALVRTFYAEAANAGACSATIITNPLEEDLSFYVANTDFTCRDERIGLVTPLLPGEGREALLNSFEDPRPRNIRRALKEGVTLERRRDAAALEFLFETHRVNIAAIGGQAKLRSFFFELADGLPPDEWSIYVASLGDRPIAALLLLYFNKTVEYFTPVIVDEFRSTQALSLVIFEAMADASSAGYVNWNWGGTWLSQTGVYDFKKRWGSREYRYGYFAQVFDRRLMSETRERLLRDYRGFFVIPFSELSSTTGGV